MSDRLYMPGIYRPDLHTALHETGGLLNFIRELNFTYGLKVATPLDNFYEMGSHPSVMLSHPSGVNCALVCWDSVEKSFVFYSPRFKKQRGSDDVDRSTVKAKSIKRLMGLIAKYDAVKTEVEIPTEQMINLAKLTVNGQKIYRSIAFEVDDDLMLSLLTNAAKTLSIDPSEIPNGQVQALSLEAVQRLLGLYRAREEYDRMVANRISELIQPEVLVIGMYEQSGIRPRDKRRGDEHVAIACVLNMALETVKPFEPIYSFDDLLNKFPEALTQLMATRIRTEDKKADANMLLNLIPRVDECDVDIPYSAFYFRHDRFHCQWFMTPIRREV